MPKKVNVGKGVGRVVKYALKTAVQDAKRIEREKQKERKKIDRERQRQDKNRAAEFKRIERERIKTQKIQEKQEALDFAKRKTEEANLVRDQLKNLLVDYNGNNNHFDWNKYRLIEPFKEKKPVPEFGLKKKEIPPEPNFEEYKIKDNLLSTIFPFFKDIKEKSAVKRYNTDLEKWKLLKNKLDSINEEILLNDEIALTEWKNSKVGHEESVVKTNSAVDILYDSYKKSELPGIEFFIDEVLSNLVLPIEFEGEWEVAIESKLVLIDFKLPQKDIIPQTKTFKYLVTKKEFTETFISEKDINKIFDLFIIQLSLIVQNVIFRADLENVIDSIVFNGWIDSIEKATGHLRKICIISLQATKEELINLKLDSVDPKSCFKQLKGFSAERISDLIPIEPILMFNKSDKRFVESTSTNYVKDENIASMHWEVFEHLIRELFEKEFISNGGEVKITQASRDGGVDAVAFDPDPIKGGKIVIQAKRYTNVVGVSAVRDLYGTVMNEGANKGILVTTSNYGADAYNFVKDKPLTLLNGSNLLFLLEKHGYNYKIDIEEARANLKRKK